MSDAAVELVGLSKSFGSVTAVDGVDLRIENGEFFSMLGPSGMFGIELGVFSLVVSHATFCMMTVFNNAIARLRRLGGTWRRRRWTSAPGPSGRSGR